MKPQYTSRQGQFMAFIHQYTTLHGRPPAEAELVKFFQVSPPSVHQMILTLERRDLITRTPGQARSIRLTLPPEKLPPGKKWVYDHPHFILLNLAIGGHWPGNPNETTKFPQQLLVDYVRAYARANVGVPALGKSP